MVRIWLSPWKKMSRDLFLSYSSPSFRCVNPCNTNLSVSLCSGSDHESSSTLLSVFSPPTFWLMSFKYPSILPFCRLWSSVSFSFVFFMFLLTGQHPSNLRAPTPPCCLPLPPRPHHFPAAAARWAGADQTGEPGRLQQGPGAHTQTGFPRCHTAR